MKPTKDKLLRWAKRKRLGIKIHPDEWTQIFKDRDDGFYLCNGDTLYQALLKAKKLMSR